jgi:hypothetical protein
MPSSLEHLPGSPPPSSPLPPSPPSLLPSRAARPAKAGLVPAWRDRCPLPLPSRFTVHGSQCPPSPSTHHSSLRTPHCCSAAAVPLVPDPCSLIPAFPPRRPYRSPPRVPRLCPCRSGAWIAVVGGEVALSWIGRALLSTPAVVAVAVTRSLSPVPRLLPSAGRASLSAAITSPFPVTVPYPPSPAVDRPHPPTVPSTAAVPFFGQPI